MFKKTALFLPDGFPNAGCTYHYTDGGNYDNGAPAGQLKSLANSGMLLRATFTLHGAGECPAYDWNKES